MAKKKDNLQGVVYSTDPEYNYTYEQEEEQVTLLPGQQDLRIMLDRKRGGKVVTAVVGFKGSASDIDKLGRTLKQFCGTGGSVKDGEILIQGDVREKVFNRLLNEGYKVKKAGG